MEFQEFWKQKDRMCTSILNCTNCGLDELDDNQCSFGVLNNPKEAEAIVQKWVDEHPVQTNADKFKEVFGVKPDIDNCPSDCASSTCCGCEYEYWWSKEYIPPESVEE